MAQRSNKARLCLSLLAVFYSASASYAVGLDACLQEPETAQLALRLRDVDRARCAAGADDAVGQSVEQCWRRLTARVEGCEVSLRPAPELHAGPGRLPCRLLALAGNLTEAANGARVRVRADGPALLDYFAGNPEAVASLGFADPRDVVADVWRYLRAYSGDTAFDDTDWLDRPLPAAAPRASAATEAQPAEEGTGSRRPALAAASGGAAPGPARALLASWVAAAQGLLSGRRLQWVAVSRSSRRRVLLRAPSGCKYKYSVSPAASHIFEPPEARIRAAAWRAVKLVVAAVAVCGALAGLGGCLLLSARHAEYLASHHDLLALKERLVGELPPPAYERLFGEPPARGAAAAASAAASATAAAARSMRAVAAEAPPAAAAAGTIEAEGKAAAAAAAAGVPEVVVVAAADET